MNSFQADFEALTPKERMQQTTKMRKHLRDSRDFALEVLRIGWTQDSRYGEALAFLPRVDAYNETQQFSRDIPMDVYEFRQAVSLLEDSLQFASMMFQVSVKDSVEKRARVYHHKVSDLPFVYWCFRQAAKADAAFMAKRRAEAEAATA